MSNTNTKMITTKDQAIQFLTTMQHLFPLVHPEDSMSQIVNRHKERTFDDNQIEYLNARFDEVYEVLADPCLTILEEIRPQMKAFNK